MVPPPFLTDTSLFPGHMCYKLEYAPPGKRASRWSQSASATTFLISDSLSWAGSDQSSTTLAEIKSSEVGSDAEQLSSTTTTDKALDVTDPPKSMGVAAKQAVESENPSSGTPKRDKRIANLATLRDQAHSPLLQYEYVAVNCEVQEPDNGAFIDETGITHIGLAHMPSSIPPAMDLLGRDEKRNSNAPLNISFHGWRRLQDVDLDDIVTECGIKAASTKLSDSTSPTVREPFRYGMKDVTTTVDCLPDHLKQQIDSLVASGRTWHTRSMQVQAKSQPTLQTQLPISFESWRAPSALDLGAPVAEMERRFSPHIKPWQQIVQSKGPAMKLYLANVQSDIERRMIQQFRVQAAFRPEQWAGSDNQEELKRLENRHESFHLDLDVMGRKREYHMSSNSALKPSTMHNQTPSPEKTTQPPKCHGKKTSPATGKPIRRILVVWNISSERHALDRLAPGFLKQLHGWVDLQQVATPVVCAASGYFLGRSHVSMSFFDAMRTVGFRPGYSLKKRNYTLANRAAHDPGMDSVRTLGVLTRLVAYPATIVSQLENEARAASNRYYRTCEFYLYGSTYPCTVFLRGNRNGRKAKALYDGLPRSLQDMEGELQLLRERGLAETVLLALGNERRALRFEPKQVCIYYDTMQQINDVVAALDGATIDNVRLKAKIHWHPDPAWHCAFSQVLEAKTVLKDIHPGPEPSVTGAGRSTGQDMEQRTCRTATSKKVDFTTQKEEDGKRHGGEFSGRGHKR